MHYMIINPYASDDIFYAAEDNGFKPIAAEKISDINPALCGHPDMHIAKAENTLIVCPEKYSYYKKSLPGVNIICGESEVKGKYPEYIAYNIVIVGEVAVHNFKYTDKRVMEYIKNKVKINVNQGYTKCSVAVAGEGIISADMGIISACKKNDISCLLVPEEGVTLEGMSRGFIGGATGYYEGVLYFSGDVGKHPGYNEIKKFCKINGIEIVCMSNDNLADIGSIIII